MHTQLPWMRIAIVVLGLLCVLGVWRPALAQAVTADGPMQMDGLPPCP